MISFSSSSLKTTALPCFFSSRYCCPAILLVNQRSAYGSFYCPCADFMGIFSQVSQQIINKQKRRVWYLGAN
ncbi:hypothetical protein ACFMKY_15610 [Pseudomonas protegens]|uniref:hypothetical protein n=1 Tax=Pseudomonas protegens TaxID=380021 RepID=UPI003671ED4A